jgi:hypothetical protein
MTTVDFWEVVASGRRYRRDYALAELEKRCESRSDADQRPLVAQGFGDLEGTGGAEAPNKPLLVAGRDQKLFRTRSHIAAHAGIDDTRASYAWSMSQKRNISSVMNTPPE